MSRSDRRRILAVGVVLAAIFALLIMAVVLRIRSAPEVARLLPQCEGIFYTNLKPIRAFTSFGSKPANWSPEYRTFVDQTGFQFERDLDEVAFAMHAPPDAEHETRYSEVMVGRFDSQKVSDFLTRNARSRESYRGQEIFLIPYEDRIIRVAMLSLDMIAVSNTGDAAQIDQIIDQFRHSAFAATGPQLLRVRYHNVPFGSVAWLITEVASAHGISLSDNISPLPFVRQLFGGGVVVGSARYNGNILLRADDYLKDASTAKDRADQLQNLLALYKTTSEQTRPEHPDPDLDAALNSLKVEQKDDRVEVSASIPSKLVEKVFESPLESEPATIAPAAPAEKARSKRHRKR
ncbi:MAG: hypothetical protein JOZ10_10945 [Acidobacteria bacterium]|nr:hypothetical protein [Acidobacteriota bacterium]MBV9145923.1 hypothetical protein [Acidobacteriota bacterium]MBV9438180.1 hypothetical protein [Acidobacteriota bacterium]